MTDRRTQLLDAAVEEIARTGTRGMRVDAIATRAGVSVALIYHHFADRAGLLDAALRHVGDRADAYTDTAVGTGRERVVAMVLDEVQDDALVRTNSAAWGELRDAAIFEPALRPVLQELTERWVQDLTAVIREGQSDASITSAASPAAVAVQLTALVEGLSSRWLTGLLSTTEVRHHLSSATDALLSPEG
ncbi:MAG: TetR/AcrR family transcriptional regulator [Ilumatobacteraceae bacterium]